MGKKLLAELREGILLADGAMGTMLHSQGLGTGECQEEWNISHREEVKSIHKRYLEAGCHLILTNTFGGNRFCLKKFGQEDKVKEFNKAGVGIAREVVKDKQGTFILGDVGPTGEFIEPLGTVTLEIISKVFREQILALAEEGVDAFIIETMSDLREARTAVRVARETGLPVLVSLSFNPGRKGFRTMMGVDIPTAIKELTESGADVLGANCGEVSPGEMVEIIKEMRSLTDKPLLAQPNAGKPTLVEGETVYQQSPEEMSAEIKKLLKAGANIIGGCCGTTPEHLARIAQVTAGYKPRRRPGSRNLYKL